MNELADGCMIEAARADHRVRSDLHARQCVCLAVVTPEPLAAELIDRAIELKDDAYSGRDPAALS